MDAISRPPWLTALALWPKGDCWHGGGLFTGRRRLLLNHSPAQATPHPKHKAHGLQVTANPDACGEDDPLYSQRLDRDGWQIEQEWNVSWLGHPAYFRTIAPERRARRHPNHWAYQIVMERRLDGLKYTERFSVEGPSGSLVLPPGRLDWVDWDRGGRLVVLCAGAVNVASMTAEGPDTLTQIVDLTNDKPEPLPPMRPYEWP